MKIKQLLVSKLEGAILKRAILKRVILKRSGLNRAMKEIAIAVTASLLLISNSTQAEEFDVQGLQKNIDMFSVVLEEVLDLDQATGLFGMSLGGIESTYLYGQGVVLELRTPLANRRNRVRLAALSSTMQSLQPRPNPFDIVSRPQLSSQLERSEAQAKEFYSSMMERVASVDYSLVISNAIQQASNAARSLRSLETVDEQDYQEMRQGIEKLRDEMAENQSKLREMVEQLRQANSRFSEAPQVELSAEMQSALTALYEKIEPLRERAIATAEDLRQRTELAEQEYVSRWQEEVIQFEESLYRAMCDYGATLRELPDDESISLVLTGLGDKNEESRRSNKVHVMSKTDVSQCQSGDIDVTLLKARSIAYSY